MMGRRTQHLDNEAIIYTHYSYVSTSLILTPAFPVHKS